VAERSNEAVRPERAESVEAEVLALVRGLLAELQPQRRGLDRIRLDDSFERDLALDSLGRAELLGRLERRFGIRLPAATLGGAESPRDLLSALRAGTPLVPSGSESVPAVTAHVEASGEPAPGSTLTLQEVLGWHAQHHPHRLHLTFIDEDESAQDLTYGELAWRSERLAAGLQSLGVEPGQAVALMLPSGIDYFVAFCGILWAGAVPVPLYPPARRSQVEDHLRRQARILTAAEAVVLITFDPVKTLARWLQGQVPSIRGVSTVAELEASRAGLEKPAYRSQDLAFLQFTSGSTGQPKGVELTHANLLANLRAIGDAIEITPEDVVVSWLPLYHDMGLIGAWMAPLYYGMRLVLMSPLSFLSRPARWLKAISHSRGTLSAAPNFAYELCAAKVRDEDIAGLDLSSWRFALNGAEPVSPEAMRRFSERFSAWKFRPESMAPVFGLAECSLALAFPPLGRGPIVDVVDRERFGRTGYASPAREGPGAARFVGCGFPLKGHEVRIVDDTGKEVADRQEGRLEFRGPSATRGYFRNPEATGQLFHDGWLDTGDRAYVAGGELFITGRVKDIIIRGGRNIYPQELEDGVGNLAGVRKGCVAAFGATDPAAGTERLVIVAERRGDPRADDEVRGEIQALAVSLLGSPADDVMLVATQRVPKTSSGKLRRSACRDLYLSGELAAEGRSPRRQVVALALGSWRGTLRRLSAATKAWLDNVWVWLVVVLAALPIFVIVVPCPGEVRRRRVAGAAGRLLLRLAGIPVRVAGIVEHSDPVIYAANHASYLDGILLMAVLSRQTRPPVVVVKRELERAPLVGVLLRRLGTVFVERFDTVRSAADARLSHAVVQGGVSLLVFPEGTFRRSPGLRSFRMGPFVTAVETGTPVVPVAIRGSRSVLRGDDYFVRRGAIDVVIGEVQRVEGEDFSAAIALRDATRRELLPHCGEADLESQDL
jgi:1-acyl-sn-glycerol-3-phosphate acyltransferase